MPVEWVGGEQGNEAKVGRKEGEKRGMNEDDDSPWELELDDSYRDIEPPRGRGYRGQE